MQRALCLVALVGAASASRSWPWDSSTKDTAKPAAQVDDSSLDDSQPKGDFMDQYIKDSGQKPIEDAPQPAPAKASDSSATGMMHSLWASLDGANSANSGSSTSSSSAGDAASSDGDLWGGRAKWPSFHHHHEEKSEEASNSEASKASSSSDFAASSSSSDAQSSSSSSSSSSNSASTSNSDSQSSDNNVQQTQRVSSVSGASATDQVVSVRLSSELQQSFLQARDAELHNLRTGRSRTAPDVEQEVAKQRMMDVYIHDGFGEAEKSDVKKEKEVNANKDMKP